MPTAVDVGSIAFTAAGLALAAAGALFVLYLATLAVLTLVSRWAGR